MCRQQDIISDVSHLWMPTFRQKHQIYPRRPLTNYPTTPFKENYHILWQCKHQFSKKAAFLPLYQRFVPYLHLLIVSSSSSFWNVELPCTFMSLRVRSPAEPLVTLRTGSLYNPAHIESFLHQTQLFVSSVQKKWPRLLRFWRPFWLWLALRSLLVARVPNFRFTIMPKLAPYSARR